MLIRVSWRIHIIYLSIFVMFSLLHPEQSNYCPCASEVSKTDHYNDVMNGAMSSQITSLTFVYSTVYSDADQRKHQSSASLAFVRGIHRGPVNSPHKWPVTRKMFPFDDVIMCGCNKVGPQHNDSRGYISWSVLYFLPWLTCWGHNKMTAILQMTFSMKIAVISLKFHWSLLSKVQLTTIRFFFNSGNGLVPNTSHYLNQREHSLLTHLCVTRPHVAPFTNMD